MTFVHILFISCLAHLVAQGNQMGMSNGTIWHARIAARLVQSICEQMNTYLEKRAIPPPEEKPDPSIAQIRGEIKWKKCADSSCQPLKMELYRKSHIRTPVTGSAYPSVALIMEFHPSGYPDGLYFGHAFFISPKKLLSTVFVAEQFLRRTFQTNFGLVVGETHQKNYTKVEFEEDLNIYKGYNNVTLENNFALLTLKSPLEFNEKVNKIPLHASGGKCYGKIKYASWPKMGLGGGDSQVWAYSEQMQEATDVFLASGPDLARSNCSNSSVCTGPLLCGMWDQGSPLICREGPKEYAYAMSSHYFIDHDNGGEVCGGISTFSLLNDGVMSWIKEHT